jgi:excisionase family DNA binding protein
VVKLILNIEEPLLTKQQVADYFHVGPRTVFNWMQKGMPHFRHGHRLVRFNKGQVQTWYEKNVIGIGSSSSSDKEGG